MILTELAKIAKTLPGAPLQADFLFVALGQYKAHMNSGPLRKACAKHGSLIISAGYAAQDEKTAAFLRSCEALEATLSDSSPEELPQPGQALENATASPTEAHRVPHRIILR